MRNKIKMGLWRKIRIKWGWGKGGSRWWWGIRLKFKILSERKGRHLSIDRGYPSRSQIWRKYRKKVCKGIFSLIQKAKNLWLIDKKKCKASWESCYLLLIVLLSSFLFLCQSFVGSFRIVIHKSYSKCVSNYIFFWYYYIYI